MQKYDLIIIGTGSGNTIITPEFDELEIAIIEKGTFGGACLNRGCIPSKMLIYAADVLTEIAESKRLGISTVIPTINWTEIQSRIYPCFLLFIRSPLTETTLKRVQSLPRSS